MSKQAKRQTMKQKKAKYGNPAAYYQSKRHKAAVQLNQELNTKEPDPEFSKDENFWDLV